MGLVSQVFSPPDLERLKGNRAIGHVRYSTTGSSNIKNAQPLVVDCARGQLAIGHNGNLINAAILRDELESRGSIFQTTVDSEIILHLLAQPSETSGVLAALRKVQGAFSLVMMSEREIIGVRDPFGFRPLWRSANSMALIFCRRRPARSISSTPNSSAKSSRAKS